MTVSLRHRLEYALYRSVEGLVRALPHAAARPLGSLVGELFHRFSARRRRIALDNLERAFPDLVAAARRRLARQCFRHFGAELGAILSFGRFDLVGFCRHLTLEGWDNLDRAEEAGRGVFLLGAHLGNWELAAQPIGIYRRSLHFVARPADNPLLEGAIRRQRERFGSVSIPKRGAVRRMLRAIQGEAYVGFLLDQRIKPHEGIDVPFFGRPARVSPALASLSLRTGAPVVPYFGFPAPRGGIRVAAREPILPEVDGRSGGEGAAALTARYLEAVEREVRAAPALWAWMHDLWKRQ